MVKVRRSSVMRTMGAKSLAVSSDMPMVKDAGRAREPWHDDCDANRHGTVFEPS
jgi:hypothetical protein